MSYSLVFFKMINFVFIVFVFLGSHTFGKLDLLGDLFGREKLVHWGGYGEEKLSTVVVGGKILCHGADPDEESSVHPYPVTGAMVAVLCGANGKTKAWAKGSTDTSGNFQIDLPSHLHSIPNLDMVCCVKVVHLPQTSPCQQAGMHKGIKLSSTGEGIRIYTAHNIHLMPRKHT